MKKLFIFCFTFFIVFFFSQTSFAVLSEREAAEAVRTAQDNWSSVHSSNSSTNADKKSATDKLDKAKSDYKKAHKAACDSSGGCLEQPSWKLDVGSFAPGGNFDGKGSSLEQRTNWFLGNIIQKLMIALGVLSVFIMTIGGGYIILHNGQDELLNKGKSIFMAGIYAMAIALSSYYFISIIRYMIYN